MLGVQFPAEEIDSSLRHNVHNGSGAYPASSPPEGVWGKAAGVSRIPLTSRMMLYLTPPPHTSSSLSV
jgi:hypothetical protein